MLGKNQQIKILVGAIIVGLLIIILLRSGKSPTPAPAPAPAPASAPTSTLGSEIQKTFEDLESIKERIKNVEKEGYRENYRSETNNGITIVGTLMEQMIDIMIAILKQPLVAETISKRISNKEDAVAIAEYIEIIGKEIVKEVEQTQLLRCGKPLVEKSEEKDGTITYWMEEGEGEVPENKCEVYRLRKDEINEGINRAKANLYNKFLSIFENDIEMDKLYRIFKNVSIDNNKEISASFGKKLDRKMMEEDFPEKKDFKNGTRGYYKHFGKGLRSELGDSVKSKELSDKEQEYFNLYKGRIGR